MHSLGDTNYLHHGTYCVMKRSLSGLAFCNAYVPIRHDVSNTYGSVRPVMPRVKTVSRPDGVPAQRANVAGSCIARDTVENGVFFWRCLNSEVPTFRPQLVPFRLFILRPLLSSCLREFLPLVYSSSLSVFACHGQTPRARCRLQCTDVWVSAGTFLFSYSLPAVPQRRTVPIRYLSRADDWRRHFGLSQRHPENLALP